VQTTELRLVGLRREARDRPRHLAEEVHHRTDVEELDAQAALLQVDDVETRGGGAGPCPRRAATLVDRLGTHEKVRQLAVGARADLLGQIGPAGSQHAADLRPQHDDRLDPRPVAGTTLDVRLQLGGSGQDAGSYLLETHVDIGV